MTEHEETELTPEERKGLDALTRERERDPGDFLEERVVRGLKARGLLRSAPNTRRRIPRSWLGAAAAAGLILFLSGLGMGQWLGSRAATDALLAVREQDATLAAARVQEAGSAYVAALATLAELQGEGASEQRSQGREAAVGALFAAADLLSRVAPNDPAVIRVLQALEDSRSGATAIRAGVPTERIIWF